MKDPAKLKDLIVENLELPLVMQSYGVDFAYDPTLADEVQFRCPFHGKDNKPSARLYNTTKSCYCWVCKKSWDVVTFIQERERLPFIPALKYIVDRYKVDTSSIPDEPDITFKKPKTSEISVEMKFILSSILSLRKKIPFEKYNALCGVYLMLDYSSSRGLDITESITKIKDKIACLNKS